MCVKAILYHVLVMILLCHAGDVWARTITLIEESVSRSHGEGKDDTCRIIARELVKRKLLAKLGTFIKQETMVRNFKITQAHVSALTAGIVGIEIMQESSRGQTCYVQARISGDLNGIVNAVDILCQDHRKVEELVRIQERAEALLMKAERLGKKGYRGEKKKGNGYYDLIRKLQAVDWFEKGYARGSSGNYTGAIEYFTHALRLNPDFSEAYFHRGFAFMSTSDFPQAVRDLEKATALDPDHERAHYHSGYVHVQLGNYRKAVEHYSRVIALNPESEQAFFNRCLARVKIGDYYQALRDCDMALDLILLKECH
ncbi:MAG: tetratricopeptide repeat protein [Deltaproteobacteria bacterium]|nr:tetratricopeptide repeat protein [Deltaproteobacteria bacterium]